MPNPCICIPLHGTHHVDCPRYITPTPLTCREVCPDDVDLLCFRPLHHHGKHRAADGTEWRASPPQRFSSRKLEVLLNTTTGREPIARAKSKTFAKRIANALNHHTPNTEGV